MTKIKIILTLFILMNLPIFGQEIGLNGGIIVNMGSHVNRFGFKLGLSFNYRFIQINLQQQISYHFTSYGNRMEFPEGRTSLGLILLAGKKNKLPDFQFDALRHNTKHQYALGYNYIWYYDKVQTSQRSGAWSLYLTNFSVFFENDVFAGERLDRFRTGVLQFSYQLKEFELYSKFYIWTGETKNSIWNKTPMKNCPNGYRRLENLKYGKTSHGIFSMGINYRFFGYQNIGFETGIDAEGIRHLIQNKITHDLLFLPKKIPRNTPHYPRLNQDGLPVFEKKQVRKPKPYFQLKTNEIWSN